MTPNIKRPKIELVDSNQQTQPIPTIVQTPGPPVLSVTSAPNTRRRKIIIVALVVVGVVLVVLTLIFLNIIPRPGFLKPKSISKQVPVTRTVVRGILTTISGTDITVDAYGKPQSFSVAGTRNFQRVISGNIGKNDTRVGLASISELKVGQEILIIVDKDSIQAKTVYILR